MYGQTGFASKQEYDRARYIRQKKEREAKRPPHPISMLTETEKAYIAGLIDGEGAIYMAHSKEKTCYPTISIHMTSEGVLRWLADKTGAQKIHRVTRRDDGRYKSILKTQFLYRTSGKNAQRLCAALIPYHRIKINHARIVCAFPVDARIAPGHKIARSDVNLVRFKLAEQLTAMNENRYRRRHSGT